MADSTPSFGQERPPATFWEWLTYCDVPDGAVARQGRLAAMVILLAEALALLVMFAQFVAPQQANSASYLSFILVVALLLPFIFLLNRRGLTRLAGVTLAVLALGIAVALMLVSGPQTPVAIALIIPVILAGLFGPALSAALIAGLAALLYLGLNLRLNPEFTTSFFRSGAALQMLIVYINLAFVALVAWLFSRTASQAVAESESLSLALVEQRAELEQRLAAQTRQLQATVTVARAVAGQRDLDHLLEDIVRLVRETFGYYHVQVFLVDERQEYALLRQSTGEVGQELLSRGHRLPVGSLSVVGQATSTGRAVIARDTDTDAVHSRNELLPLTRSEMAVPLTVGNRVIGALDLQSDSIDAFTEDAIPTLQALADQLAIAIENARLYEQTQENLRELRELSRDVTRRSWADFLSEVRDEERRQVYGPEPQELSTHRSRVVERVLNAGSMIVASGEDGRQSFIAAPIVVRNEVVGVIGVEPDGIREWTKDDLQLLKTIADRAALAVENARLYLKAQRSAERERLIGTISTRLQRAPSLALLLESVTRELAEALGTDNVYAEISLEHPLARGRAGRDEERVDTVDAQARPTGEARPVEPEAETGSSQEAKVNP